MDITRRRFDRDTDLRLVQDMSHRVWRRDPRRLGFETSFGTLAWEGGGEGRGRMFERDGHVVGWARLTPGYRRIRRMGVWDAAPPSLVWLVDPDETDPSSVLEVILQWAESRSDAAFTTSHAQADEEASHYLRTRGYVPDPDEPFGIYLQQPLHDVGDDGPTLPGYRFTTMADLDDVEVRAELHRRAWDGSTRSADDVRATMSTWPYRADLDVVAVADDGSPAASALAWYDAGYGYGEFEPVGTATEHRGRGVGAATLHFGLARLRDAGASHAVVGARGDDDYPVPRRLYRSVGFMDVGRQVMVRRTRPS